MRIRERKRERESNARTHLAELKLAKTSNDSSTSQKALDSNTNSTNTAEANVESSQDSTQKVRLDSSRAYYTEDYEAYQSGAQVSKKLLESSPSGNGDIGSALKILPNVQFENAQNRSTTPGEIDPAKISISGGAHYQNLFTIDGIGMNNDLDPAGSADWLGGAPGRSQGLAIDTSLLDSIKVLDSNISAAYGGFMGGVVESSTKKPSKDFGANISYQFTQGNANRGAFSLTQYNVDNLDSFLDSVTNSYNDNNSPYFTKHILRASVESKINDRFGIIGSFTTTQSFIPLRYNSNVSNNANLVALPADVNTRKQTQKRQIYNVYLKGYYDMRDDMRLELSYAYMPQFDFRFMSGTLDDYFSFDSGGHQIGGKFTWDNSLGTLTNTLSYSFLENSTTLHGFSHTKYWYPSVNKNWGRFGSWSREGGYAPTESTQHTLSNKLIQDFSPLVLANTTHRFQVGLELAYQFAKFGYSQDYFFIRNNGNVKAMTEQQKALCVGVYTEWCDTSPTYGGGSAFANGQFFGHTELYRESYVKLHNFVLGAFIEDDIAISLQDFGALNTRVGLRLDYDTYMQKYNLAPRLSLNYEAPWNATKQELATNIIAGANRYYGRNIFAYALKAKMNAMAVGIARDNPNVDWYDVLNSGVECQTSNSTSSGNANCIQTYKENVKFSQLKVPYTNELTLGVVQRIYDINLSAKYIHRATKDDIRYVRSDTAKLPADSAYTSNYYIYTNDGKSYSDIITLSIENTAPLEIFNTKHYMLFAFDWMDTRRNYTSYAEAMSADQLADSDILWNGEVVPYSQRPASNYMRPYTIRLSTTHNFETGKVKWLFNSFFRLRSPYFAVAKIHTAGTSYDRCVTNARYCPNAAYNPAHNDKDQFVKQRLPLAFNWDVRIGFEVPVYKRHIFYMNVDIYNVLNRQNVTILTSEYAGTSTSPTLGYEVGRQFWLQVGYKY